MSITTEARKPKPFTRRERLGKASLAAMAAACCFAVSAPGIGTAQTIVRDVDAPVRQPFQTQIANRLVDDNGQIVELASVPLGKRLVVEHVSLYLIVPPTPQKQSSLQVLLRTQLGGQTVDHVLVPDKARELAANRAEVFAISQPIRAYADAGTTVSAVIVFDAVGRTVTQANLNRLSLSGHFVDIAQ